MVNKITTNIDLHNFEVKDKADEDAALFEMLAQIKMWLSEKGINRNKVYSILLNKLIYYSARELALVNPAFKISGGWYRYGPCFEAMREREMSEETIEISDTKNKTVVEEIIKVCEEEVPIYLKTIEKGIRTENRYFYDYLMHIYTSPKRMVYPELANFYPAKHKLSKEVLDVAYDSKSNTHALTRMVIKFNSEITKSKYVSFVGIDYSTICKVHDFTLALEETLVQSKELESQGKVNLELMSTSQHMAHVFDEIPLGSFAYKNYYSTYVDVSPEEESMKKEGFLGQAQRYLTRTESNTLQMLSTLQHV